MNITHFRDYDSMSVQAASLIMSAIGHRKDLLLCAATGGSTIGLYNELVDKSETDGKLFDHLRVIKLDEWGGVPENDPVSCEYYLRTRLLAPLTIPDGRYISFASDPADPIGECKRIQLELDQQGPIDVCVLGLGKNGHIGFNEPNSFLKPYCHVAELSNESTQHNMVRAMKAAPQFGLTLGVQNIMSARKILLLVSGENKASVTEKLLQEKIDTNLPASLLWLHNNVECLIDENVFSK